MIVLSLFDGISCGHQVLKDMGIKIDKYYSSEIDKYALAISESNHPDQIRLGDVRHWREWGLNLGEIDLILAGSPCQSFSIAGHRKGFEGVSGIIVEFFEILEEAMRQNPNVKFFLENVKMPPKWEMAITQRLGVTPHLLDSANFSAQSRKRLYWFNWSIPPLVPHNKAVVGDVLEKGISYKDKSYAITCSYDKLTFTDSLSKHRRDFVAEPLREAIIGKGGQGERVYSVRGKSVCLVGNAGGMGAKTGLYKIDLPDGDYFFRKLTPIECERLQGLPDNYTRGGGGISQSQRYKCLGNAWQCDTIKYIFSFGGLK